MTVIEAGKKLASVLNEIYEEREAANITELIIESITGLTKTQRLINKQLILTPSQQYQLQNFTNQLLQHKPVQYILHEAWFAGIKFYVDENVLIPRPETEELVDAVITAVDNKKMTILDIGTGSGCIAISLKKKLETINIYALDISDKALCIAQKNAALNGVEINFMQADILQTSNWDNIPMVDIIVSNPPYIKSDEIQQMSQNVIRYEPHSALFVPDNDPLVFYRAIADFSLQFFKAGKGALFFEIHENRGRQAVNLLKQKGFSNIRVKKDLQGKDRIVTAVL
ncbi:MAG: peptide chain release factor N(5)-glutamine methyltransferase [Parafilimonas sp.]|nr:peptide chain release factor N(5)-glutamine methyltransferase [Parafilimonas sp.]